MIRNKFKNRAVLFAAPAVIAVAGLLAAAPDKAPPETAATVPFVSQETMDVANSLSKAFRDVATHVLPAVVAIESRPDTSGKTIGDNTNNRTEQANPFKGTPFEDMFRDQLRSIPNQKQSPRSQGGIGSGVIIDPAGIVLTNNHVVAGGGQVIIRTSDGREFEATEVLTDPQTDIAVVKFKGAKDLVAAKIGNSDLMEVGDWVVALGQPFGLEGTVTTGIVSGKNRGIGIADRENFIQTDAAINPGNSGGPLVNLKGEIIGINTAISSRGGGNNGVGFAVPSNLAQWVSNQLVQTGHVERSYLGVAIQPVSYELSTQLGVAPKSGVVVTNVMSNSPAKQAGLKPGDVIVKFGEIAVHTPQQLQLAVERSPKGKSLPVEVVRDGKTQSLTYTGTLAPNDFGASTKLSIQNEDVQLNVLGLEVSTLTSDIAKQLDMEGQTGVVITRVQEQGAAAEAGLKPGMLIVQVNRQDVANAEDFGKLVEADTDGSLLLLVHTEQGSRFVVVRN